MIGGIHIMKNLIKYKILLTGMLIITACFFYSRPAYAKPVSAEQFICSSGNTAGTDSTGINELDESMNRGTQVLVGICRALGGACGIVGIVLALIGFFGHQQDLKAQAPIFIFVGVGIFFAPEIFNFLVGKK